MPHLDSEPLGLIRPRNHTPVVVRQDDDRPPVEIGPERPFTGDEEVVAIGETVHDGLRVKVYSLRVKGLGG